MGKSKGKSKGKKGGKKKGKKGKKPVVTEIEGPPPPPDTFFWVRRKTTSILIEAFDEQTIPEIKEIISGIIKLPPEDFKLFKGEKELTEFKKGGKSSSAGGGAKENSSGKSNSKKSDKSKKGKSKKGKKGKGKSKGTEDATAGDKKKGGADGAEPMRLVDHGLDVRTASLFEPATIFLVQKDEGGVWEVPEVVPWTKAAEIPEVVKPYLRNYAAALPEDNLQRERDDEGDDGTSGSGSNKSRTTNKSRK